MRRAIAALAALGCALGLALVATATSQPAGAARPLRLTVGTAGSIGSLDPRHGDSAIAREVWDLQYPTLTSLDPQSFDAAPSLAGGWSPATRPNAWIYNLRPNLTWSDGQPVTAADVVYSLDQTRDDHWPYAAGMLDGLTARALDAHSVEVTAAHPDASLPNLLLHVVPEHVFAKVADLDTNLAAMGVSDGTWHVVTKSAASVQLDATDPTAGPALQQVVFRTYGDTSALIDALTHHDVDVISGVPDTDIDRLEGLSKVTVDHASDGTQYTLAIGGIDDPALRDARVREAISLAIDRSQLVADVVNGVGTPVVVPALAIGASWGLDDATVQSLSGALDAQPNRARQLLGEAPAIGRALTLSLPPDATSVRVGAYLRTALTAVGIRTTIFTGSEHALGSSPDLALRLTTIGTDPTAALRSLACEVCAAQFRKYSSSTDSTTQLDAAHEMLQRATAQAFVVGLFEPDTLQAFQTANITGFLPEPQQRSLVVFAPTITQYAQLSAAGPPPGEQSSNTTYVVGALIVLALCAAAYWVAARIRRHYAG